jgi:hypothetical protein
MRKTFFALFFLAVSVPYSFSWGTPVLNSHYYEKPFVFRALVPTFATMFPNVDLAASVIILGFCVGLGLVMVEIVDAKWRVNSWNEFAISVSFLTSILVMEVYKEIYDIPSAFFFSLLLLLWIKEKYALSIPVFVLACINKETAVLIIPVLFIIGRSWKHLTIQVFTFILVKVMISWSLSDYPGQDFYFRPVENIVFHYENLLITIGMIAFGIYAFLSTYKHKSNHYGLTVFVTLLFPAFILVYIVFGNPFEVRVFGEVMPILFMGAFLR